MEQKENIFIIRVCHSVLCMLMTFFGTVLLCGALTPSNGGGGGSGHGGALNALFLLIALGISLFLELVGLIIIHCIGKKIAIPLVPIMLVGALFSIIADYFEFTLAMFLMLPFYWLVSWLTEKYIERLRKREE